MPVTATLWEGVEDIYVAHIPGSALGPDAGFAPGSPIDMAFVTDIYDKKETMLKRNYYEDIGRFARPPWTEHSSEPESKPRRCASAICIAIMQNGKIGTADLMLKAQ